VLRKNAQQEFGRKAPNRELMPPRGTSFTYCQNQWYVASWAAERKGNAVWDRKTLYFQYDKRREQRCDVSYSTAYKRNSFVKAWLIKLNAPECNAAFMHPFNFFCVFSRLFLLVSHIDFWKSEPSFAAPWKQCEIVQLWETEQRFPPEPEICFWLAFTQAAFEAKLTRNEKNFKFVFAKSFVAQIWWCVSSFFFQKWGKKSF